MVSSSILEIKKRSGRIVAFELKKIARAIHKALLAAKEKDGQIAEELAQKVVLRLGKRYAGKIPGVENVQDIVEETLIKEGYAKAAKAFILYRQKRAEVRATKKFFGIEDELKLTVNAARVLEKRYLLKDETGNIIETPSQMFRRVAKEIAAVDSLYDKKADICKVEEEFYKAMVGLEFLPNSPTLMNAGTELGQLSACFVLPVEDSLEEIFNAIKYMAIIQKSGGGTGFSFSRLRPKGDVVKTTGGIASGPLSFMRVFDVATEVIKQGGRRRGANMGILRVDHPDILEFITAKTKENFLTNFNLSVAVTDEFMESVEKDKGYPLINPRIGKEVKKLRAKDVFDLITTMAWRTGDPGMIFIDEINRHNQTPLLGQIESTNPCGEQVLLPFESCNLGSINLSKMVKGDEIDWETLKKTVKTAVHFLDNVIDANNFTLPEIEQITKGNRKVGLGVMGFADALTRLKIPYNSEEAIELAEKIMKFISEEARKTSIEMAKTRGAFPNFKGSIYDKSGNMPLRNATLTTIAPTGTISIIAGCSGGIEPLFAVSFIRNVMEGTKLLETNHLFEEIVREKGFYSENLMLKIAKRGSVKGLKEVPKDLQKVFVTAFEISPEWHVRMQAAFQKYTDNAVSKTINFAADASVEEVKKAYLLAYKLKCKGITAYRYGSKQEQVLYIGEVIGKEKGETFEYVGADLEYAGGCPEPYCPF